MGCSQKLLREIQERGAFVVLADPPSVTFTGIIDCAARMPQHTREPRLYIDIYCRDPGALEHHHLPVTLMAPERLVVLMGATAMSRLWVLMEIFIFVEAGNHASSIDVLPVAGYIMPRADDAVDAAACECEAKIDSTALQKVIEACGSATKFYRRVGDILREANDNMIAISARAVSQPEVLKQWRFLLHREAQVYSKTAKVLAKLMTSDGIIESIVDGNVEDERPYERGDYIMIGSKGNRYPMQKEQFSNRYDTLRPKPASDPILAKAGFKSFRAIGKVRLLPPRRPCLGKQRSFMVAPAPLFYCTTARFGHTYSHPKKLQHTSPTASTLGNVR